MATPLNQPLINYVIFGIAIAASVYLFGSHNHGLGIKPKPAIDCTDKVGNEVKVNINDNGFDPRDIQAKLCDILIIKNTGNNGHEPAVGPHPYHTAYPGLDAEKLLAPNQEFRFVLNRPGQYPLHDHDNPKLAAKLTVSP